MINIRAFKGIYYNQDKITDISQVVCPPYDVINEEERDFYYHQSPYNFIRLILNKEEKEDNDSNNKYSRPVVFFNDWLKAQILKQDSKDSIYFYKQDYFYNNKEFSRLGFIALLQIGNSGVAFPHENTRNAPKMDRFELIKKVKANLSPIFTIFSDKEKIIEKIFKEDLSRRKPDFLLKDTQGVRNSVWRLTDAEKIQKICSKMQNKQIFIADGHHRYEVALMYLNLMRQEDKNYSLDKSYNYVMTYFTTLESDGICVMPTHRIIKSKVDLSRLGDIFKKVKLNSIADLEEKLAMSSKKPYVFGFYADGNILLLELKDKNKADSYFKEKKCFKNLDVAILDFYVLNELLKIKKDDIMYTKEITEAKEAVDKKDGLAAFILRPTSVSQIRDVALCGEKMPPKSTYFYPKLLSGLVVHKFE
ncbi:MAG: DUF1015 domain-containing protein [Candidatus Omnitrophica bacterium]|nr:DUF1015 domain-containing protein [Candidatus Omnitrophota bacterium]MDD5352177.1 DUF1015 domain-containing protein [Candidatus Omnitrophota bacterium]MDD5549775.1 DUF1015 domain-containing protein [Candidatus Omnitrophota bacterium]